MRLDPGQVHPKLADYARSPKFNSSDDQERYHVKVREARAAQAYPIAVAPGASLTVTRNNVPINLQAGSEVLPTDAVGPLGSVAVLVGRLEDRGVIVVLDELESRARNVPKSARYIVAAGSSVMTKNGVICGEVVAADFHGGQADLDDLVRRGAVIDRNGKQ